jgi:VWFA-related protein
LFKTKNGEVDAMSKSKTMSLLLSITALIFLSIAGCGGGGGGSDFPLPPPNNTVNSADLSLTKTVDIPTPDVGTDVVFTITVSNAGPSDATGVVVTDLLPSGFTYVTDDSGGAYNPATGVWSVGTVTVGGSQALTITATVKDTGNYINRAQVTAANESDPNTNNDFDGEAAAPPGIKVTINQIQTACQIPGATSDKAYVTVIDQLGNPVTTLNDLVFTLTESQNSQNFPVNNFDVAFTNESLSISIVLDYSQSMFDSDSVTAMEDATVAFINQLSADDEAELIKFNKEITVVQPFTTDKKALIAAVDSVFLPAAVTELYRATIKGIDNTATRDPENRKAVVVITDGRNNSFSPNVTSDTVIADANAKGIPVFTIGLGAESDWADLEKIASDTGGQFYPSYQIDDLEEDFIKLAESLIKNQFVFTYSSALPGGAPAPATLTVEADYKGLKGSDTKGFTSCP